MNSEKTLKNLTASSIHYMLLHTGHHLCGGFILSEILNKRAFRIQQVAYYAVINNIIAVFIFGPFIEVNFECLDNFCHFFQITVKTYKVRGILSNSLRSALVYRALGLQKRILVRYFILTPLGLNVPYFFSSSSGQISRQFVKPFAFEIFVCYDFIVESF